MANGKEPENVTDAREKRLVAIEGVDTPVAGEVNSPNDNDALKAQVEEIRSEVTPLLNQLDANRGAIAEFLTEEQITDIDFAVREGLTEIGLNLADAEEGVISAKVAMEKIRNIASGTIFSEGLRDLRSAIERVAGERGPVGGPGSGARPGGIRGDRRPRRPPFARVQEDLGVVTIPGRILTPDDSDDAAGGGDLDLALEANRNVLIDERGFIVLVWSPDGEIFEQLGGSQGLLTDAQLTFLNDRLARQRREEAGEELQSSVALIQTLAEDTVDANDRLNVEFGIEPFDASVAKRASNIIKEFFGTDTIEKVDLIVKRALRLQRGESFSDLMSDETKVGAFVVQLSGLVEDPAKVTQADLNFLGARVLDAVFTIFKESPGGSTDVLIRQITELLSNLVNEINARPAPAGERDPAGGPIEVGSLLRRVARFRGEVIASIRSVDVTGLRGAEGFEDAARVRTLLTRDARDLKGLADRLEAATSEEADLVSTDVSRELDIVDAKARNSMSAIRTMVSDLARRVTQTRFGSQATIAIANAINEASLQFEVANRTAAETVVELNTIGRLINRQRNGNAITADEAERATESVNDIQSMLATILSEEALERAEGEELDTDVVGQRGTIFTPDDADTFFEGTVPRRILDQGRNFLQRFGPILLIWDNEGQRFDTFGARIGVFNAAELKFLNDRIIQQRARVAQGLDPVASDEPDVFEGTEVGPGRSVRFAELFSGIVGAVFAVNEAASSLREFRQEMQGRRGDVRKALDDGEITQGEFNFLNRESTKLIRDARTVEREGGSIIKPVDPTFVGGDRGPSGEPGPSAESVIDRLRRTRRNLIETARELDTAGVTADQRSAGQRIKTADRLRGLANAFGMSIRKIERLEGEDLERKLANPLPANFTFTDAAEEIELAESLIQIKLDEPVPVELLTPLPTGEEAPATVEQARADRVTVLEPRPGSSPSSPIFRPLPPPIQLLATSAATNAATALRVWVIEGKGENPEAGKAARRAFLFELARLSALISDLERRATDAGINGGFANRISAVENLVEQVRNDDQRIEDLLGRRRDAVAAGRPLVIETIDEQLEALTSGTDGRVSTVSKLASIEATLGALAVEVEARGAANTPSPIKGDFRENAFEMMDAIEALLETLKTGSRAQVEAGLADVARSRSALSSLLAAQEALAPETDTGGRVRSLTNDVANTLERIRTNERRLARDAARRFEASERGSSAVVESLDERINREVRGTDTRTGLIEELQNAIDQFSALDRATGISEVSTTPEGERGPTGESGEAIAIDNRINEALRQFEAGSATHAETIVELNRIIQFTSLRAFRGGITADEANAADAKSKEIRSMVSKILSEEMIKQAEGRGDQVGAPDDGSKARFKEQVNETMGRVRKALEDRDAQALRDLVSDVDDLTRTLSAVRILAFSQLNGIFTDFSNVLIEFRSINRFYTGVLGEEIQRAAVAIDEDRDVFGNTFKTVDGLDKRLPLLFDFLTERGAGNQIPVPENLRIDLFLREIGLGVMLDELLDEGQEQFIIDFFAGERGVTAEPGPAAPAAGLTFEQISEINRVISGATGSLNRPITITVAVNGEVSIVTPIADGEDNDLIERAIRGLVVPQLNRFPDSFNLRLVDVTLAPTAEFVPRAMDPKFALVTIDRFEGPNDQIAVLVPDVGEPFDFLRASLPAGAEAGDVINNLSTFNLAERQRIADRTRRIQEELTRRDPGGDIDITPVTGSASFIIGPDP